MNFPLLEILNIKTGCFPPRQTGPCSGQLSHTLLPAAPGVTGTSSCVCDPFLLENAHFPPNSSLVLSAHGTLSRGGAGTSLKSSSCSPALPACSCPPRGAAAQMCLCSRCAASLQTCSGVSPQSWDWGHDSHYILNFRQGLAAGTGCQGSERAWGLPSTGADEVQGLGGVANSGLVSLRALKVIFFSPFKTPTHAPRTKHIPLIRNTISSTLNI